MAQDVLAIGVDGGASGVRALAVRRGADGFLGAVGSVERADHDRFDAAELASQRAEASDPRRSDAEIAAADARRRAAVDVIVRATGGEPRIALGLCWPGIKTADGRGVAVMRNGPRDPRFVDELERDLASRGVELASPCPPLASDGVAGALGERWSGVGLLRDIDDALYFAGGSGLAEALLTAGRVRAVDDPSHRLPKAYELMFDSAADSHQISVFLASERLQAFEDALAPGRWTHGRAAVDPALTTGFPSGKTDWFVAFQRDPDGVQRALRMASRALVRYIEDRMRRLREPAGIVPTCAVVGARLGGLLASAELRRSLREPVEDGLERLGLARDFVRASTLLEAPCYGAAAIALGLEDRACRS